MTLPRLLPCLTVSTVLGIVASTVAASEQPAFVLGVKGAPMATEASGMTRRARVLQDIYDGEVVALERGDVLTVCDPSHGSFEVAGPGTVRLSDFPTMLSGSPRIVRHGPCEEATTADGNGGVLLRRLRLHGKVRAVAGQ